MPPDCVSALSAGRITSSLWFWTSLDLIPDRPARYGQRVFVQQAPPRPAASSPRAGRRHRRTLPSDTCPRASGSRSSAHRGPSGPSRPGVRSIPTRPAIASRWITALVLPPIAALVRIAFSNASRVRMSDGFRSSFTICTIRRPVRCAITRRRRIHRRNRRIARQGHAQRLDHASHRADAVPIVLHDPGERRHRRLGLDKLLRRHLARFHGLGELPQMRARAHPFALEIAVQHRPAGDHDGRQIDRTPPPSASDGVVLSQPTRQTTPSICWPRMVSSTAIAARLRNIIAVGRNPDFADRKHRHDHRKTARLVDTVLHPLGQIVQMRVARVQLADQVFRIPITGRPSNRSAGRPWFFIQER